MFVLNGFLLRTCSCSTGGQNLTRLFLVLLVCVEHHNLVIFSLIKLGPPNAHDAHKH